MLYSLHKSIGSISISSEPEIINLLLTSYCLVLDNYTLYDQVHLCDSNQCITHVPCYTCTAITKASCLSIYQTVCQSCILLVRMSVYLSINWQFSQTVICLSLYLPRSLANAPSLGPSHNYSVELIIICTKL